jgi:MarR family transcriptional regulator, organic hydroperoxide resistance regulator
MPTVSKLTQVSARPSRRRRKEPLTDTLAFMRRLWAVDHRLRSLSRQMHTRMGMTGPQRLVLRLVGRASQITPSQLAALLHLDRGTLSGIVERLTSQRLLLRKPHPEDGRSALLQLSARGRVLDQEAAGTVEACVGRALASLPRSKVAAAAQVLEALARELEIEEQRGAGSAGAD